MRIGIVFPGPRRNPTGNRVTAQRWARILRGLGHRVTLGIDSWRGNVDLLLALHACRCAPAIAGFRARFPLRPVLLALTGTDLYRDLPASRPARRALEQATRLITLQPHALWNLPPQLRWKARVLYQSARPTPGLRTPARRAFRACVIGNLRRIKDPMRAALAVRDLPPVSKIRVVHAGRVFTAAMERQARAETRGNPRYEWIGELPRWKARRLIARSRLLILTSRMEGGANVVSEAVVDGVPVLSSRIPGSLGLLGEEYPGYFPVGRTRALRRLLLRAENDPAFLRDLRKRCRTLAPLFHPRRERAAWRALLREVSPG